MKLFHGHEVEKIIKCNEYHKPITKRLDECYGRCSSAKKSIYNKLMDEYSDAEDRAVWSHNCSFFTFVARYDDGYIYVTHTKRVAYIY